MKKRGAFLVVATCVVILACLTGCGPSARQYAQEARSSYISARAVLVGVQEFPSQMEELLRSRDPDALGEEADELTADTRDLLSASSAAFDSCKDKCQNLKNSGSKKFDPYADDMLQLVALNQQLITAYSEFVGLSDSLSSDDSYALNPDKLMPKLDALDLVAIRIETLQEQIAQLEEQAEQLYITLTE